MEICENMLFNFYCNSCDYKCCKKSSWVQHLATTKHVNANNGLIQANPFYKFF